MSASSKCCSLPKGASAFALAPDPTTDCRPPRPPAPPAPPCGALALSPRPRQALPSSLGNIFDCSPPRLSGLVAGAGLDDDSAPGNSPPAPSIARPRNWKFSTTTVSLLRFPPPCLSSHVSNFSRPSTKIGLPLVQYWLIVSAWRPKAVQSTNAVSSLSTPSAVRYFRLTARPNSATTIWLGRCFTCGSRVKLPIRNT